MHCCRDHFLREAHLHCEAGVRWWQWTTAAYAGTLYPPIPSLAACPVHTQLGLGLPRHQRLWPRNQGANLPWIQQPDAWCFGVLDVP